MKELGVDATNFTCIGNNTYSHVPEKEADIIERHCKLQKDMFGIDVDEINKKLPRIFWNPKLHKNPYKARYIAGATNCSTKQLSRLVTKALQELLKNFKRYCKGIYRKRGVNCDWGINSTKQFLEKLQNKDNIFSVQVHDFSTLYTNLELAEVKKALKGMIELIFNLDSNKFINISLFKNTAFFARKKYNGFYTFDKNTLIEAVNFILDNAFVIFGDFILKQNWGIPMGGNCSSEIANCTLGWFEFLFMQSLLKKKDRVGLTKLLSNISRYVDDLITFNYTHFDTLYPKIYPRELLMERSGTNDKQVNYLDLTIQLDNAGSFTTNVYSKQNDFNFDIIKFTHPSSNIPLVIGHNVFYGQILRYADLCSQKEFFVAAVKNLYSLLIERGYQKLALLKKFRRALGRNPSIWVKYECLDSSDLESLIFV